MIALFERFEDSIYKVNEFKNVTRVPKEECVTRHFLDSLIVSSLIPNGASVCDLGCGPGFPSWPLAAVRPDLSVTAIDSNRKMLLPLDSVPLPNLQVVCARAEDQVGHESFDVVTGRAFAPLSVQIEVSAGLLKPGGKLLPLRSLNEPVISVGTWLLGLELLANHEIPVPETETVRWIPEFQLNQPLPKGYPRPWATIKAKPISL